MNNTITKKKTSIILKIISSLFLALIVILGAGILGFVSGMPKITIGDFRINIGKDVETESIDTSNYLLLSTIIDSPLLKNIDLMVPNDTFLPTEEEIRKTYSNLSDNSIVASTTNADIIIQNYDIEFTKDITLMDFRNYVVSSLKESRPDIDFDTSRTIKREDSLEIPVIEFSTEHQNRVTYSFIALLNINEKFFTITVHNMNELLYAREFFDSLLCNMIFK